MCTPAAGSAATRIKSPAKTVQTGHKMPYDFQELSGTGREKAIRPLRLYVLVIVVNFKAVLR